MGKVFFVGAGPGDPDLITIKGLRLLEKADVLIYTGSLVSEELIRLSPAPVKTNSHGMHLPDLIEAMVGPARQGKCVVRLHSGDPSLYGAIVEQIDGLREKGVEAEVIPGVSSLFAAAAALTTQLTLSGIADSIIITRPAGRTLEKDYIREFSSLPATLAIFLGTEHLEEITGKVVCPLDTPAAVVFHASWPDQVVVRGTVKDIATKARQAGITRTALLLIGGVVARDLTGFNRSELYS
ncbi:MAG: SAM-dependent methyltransferase [Methanomicrobiales archaeon]|nr:SAM-dependent methyltransferase [Methanomicrobiales archaeon]